MAEQKSVDKIADAIVRHQIRLIRLSAGTGRRLVEQLTSLDEDLERLLERRLRKAIKPRTVFNKTTKKTVAAIVKAIERVTNPTWKNIETELRKELLIVAKAEVGFIGTTIATSLPVTVQLTDVPDKIFRRLTFSDPIDDKTLNQWTKGIRRSDRRQFAEEIQAGLIQGNTARQIVRRIFGTVILNGTDGTRKSIERGLQGITQTSINSVTNRARTEFYLRNKDIVQNEIFVATLDARTTAICRATDGKKFPVGTGLIPPLHFNCRSVRVPDLNVRKLATRPATGVFKSLLDGTKGNERRRLVSQLTGQVPAETTYQQFLKRQTVGFQNEVLGIKKAKLFRKGGLTLDKFINQAGSELTLKDLFRLHPEAFEKAGITL